MAHNASRSPCSSDACERSRRRCVPPQPSPSTLTTRTRSLLTPPLLSTAPLTRTLSPTSRTVPWLAVSSRTKLRRSPFWVPDVSHTSLTPSLSGFLLLRPMLFRIPKPGCPTTLLGVPPGVLCKRRRNLYFAGGLCQANPRTNEGKSLTVSSSLASRPLISIRSPLETKKAYSPRRRRSRPHERSRWTGHGGLSQ